MRWFDEDQLGFAFGCVFAIGEFFGALAYYVGALIVKYCPGGYLSVYLAGMTRFLTLRDIACHSSTRPDIMFWLCLCAAAGMLTLGLVAMLAAYCIDKDVTRAAIRREEREVVHKRLRDKMSWTVTVLTTQTRSLWISMWLVVLFYMGFYSFVTFTAYV